MTPAGIDELKLDEGCRLHAYLDTVGVWTIGWGYTGPEVNRGLVWTQKQADDALAHRVAGFEEDVARELPWSVTLDPVRKDVLAQLAYNLGIEGLKHWPVTLRAIRRGAWSEAAADILANPVWCGQVGRRAKRIASALRTGHWA